MFRQLRSIFVLAAIILTTQLLWAARILKVKEETKVIIDLEDMVAEQGTLLVAISPEGKKKAIIKIVKIKGNKALGRKLKGSAQVGYTLVTREQAKQGHTTSPEKQEEQSSESSEPGKQKTIALGGLLGLAMDRMDVEITDSDTANMNGIGFSGKAFLDYHHTDWLGFRGMAGIEMLKTAGTTENEVCGDSADCKTDIVYGALDLLARITFVKSSVDAWVGVGVGVVFPLSKDTNALKDSSIIATSLFLIAAGLDWNISPDYFIPLALDYAIFPASDQVTANWTAFRAGFGMRF